MKKLLAMSAAFILATGCSVSAQNLLTKFSTTENSVYSLPFSKIVVDDDIDLVLYENVEKNIQVEGRRQDVSNVQWKIKNGSLHLWSKEGSLKNRVLVTLSVSELKKIVINGESEVRSLGNLSSALLYIDMNGFGLVNIINAGKMVLANGEGIGLDVRKKTTNVYISADESLTSL